ncbi:hypothetical protein [Providencia phage PSTCR5]|uniref:Uncharacterized protein n=1 Tax=Providencia phage PSTCR5 TaxID=2783547 RepID=A0A873WSC7_9CAUD|nr:hypothetical protein KNV68_gp110 [Providencia phage PSTCR5]QPB12248.1 hypothetical protein [Providencia phage PSTCR5]
MLQESVNAIIEESLGDRVKELVGIVHNGIIQSAKKRSFCSSIQINNATKQFSLNKQELVSLLQIVSAIFEAEGGILMTYAISGSNNDLSIGVDVLVSPTDTLASYLVKIYDSENDNG